MQRSPQILFRHMEPSEAVTSDIMRRLQHLERFHNHISGCRVTVEAPELGHHRKALFRVIIDLDVPGGPLVVGHGSPQKADHTHLPCALRDAFNSAETQLKEFLRRKRVRKTAAKDMPSCESI